METPKTYETKITIAADITKVWDALINPEMTKHYMFGCVPETDWQPGSKISWKGAADGVEYVVGKVVKFEPRSVLSLTAFNPNSEFPDDLENHLTAEYLLTSDGPSTNLHITQFDFSTVADGQKRYEEAAGSWEMSLAGLKKLVEN